MNKKITLTFLLAVFCQPVYAMDYLKNVGLFVECHKYVVALGALSCLRSYNIYRHYKDSVAGIKKCAEEESDNWCFNAVHSMYNQQSDFEKTNLEKIKSDDLLKIRSLINKYVEDGKALNWYICRSTTLQNLDNMEVGVCRDGKDVVIVLNQLALYCLHNKQGFTLKHFESVFIHEAAHINENHAEKKLRIEMVQPLVDLLGASLAFSFSDSFKIAATVYGCSYIANIFLCLAYSRHLERRADAAVFKTQDKDKINNFKNALKIISSFGDQKDVPSIFSTHPSLKERIDSCDQALAQLQAASKS